MRKNRSRVIFCPNQITISVALGLAKHDDKLENTTVIYWPDRCDVLDLVAIGVKCTPYSRTACLSYLLKNVWKSHIEVLLPHNKLGRSVNWLARICFSAALIDDGLDTLREEPRNVDPRRFEFGAKFYTFKYTISLGGWLNKFEINRVANLSTMAEGSKKILDLAQVQHLIIESPPLERIEDEFLNNAGSTVLISHSNPTKRVINNFLGLSFVGSSIALERSLDSFSGEMIVGESMLAVYALMLEKPKFRVKIYLAKENINNLRPLIQLIESRDYASLRSC